MKSLLLVVAAIVLARAVVSYSGYEVVHFDVVTSGIQTAITTCGSKCVVLTNNGLVPLGVEANIAVLATELVGTGSLSTVTGNTTLLDTTAYTTLLAGASDTPTYATSSAFASAMTSAFGVSASTFTIGAMSVPYVVIGGGSATAKATVIIGGENPREYLSIYTAFQVAKTLYTAYTTSTDPDYNEVNAFLATSVVIVIPMLDTAGYDACISTDRNSVGSKLYEGWPITEVATLLSSTLKYHLENFINLRAGLGRVMYGLQSTTTAIANSDDMVRLTDFVAGIYYDTQTLKYYSGKANDFFSDSNVAVDWATANFDNAMTVELLGSVVSPYGYNTGLTTVSTATYKVVKALGKINVNCFWPLGNSTTNAPSLDITDSKFQSMDQLTLTILAPKVATRGSLSFMMGSCNCNTDTTNFVITPGTTADACVNQYTVAVPWAHLTSSCGVRKLGGTQLDNTMRYRGVITATYTEQPISSVQWSSLSRTVSNDLIFDVLFQTQVIATSSVVKIYGSMILHAAISDLKSTVSTNDNADISVSLQITSGVQNPFQLTYMGGSAASAIDPTATVTQDLTLITSTPIANVRYQQLWSMAIAPVGIKKFDNLVITLVFNATCQSGTLATDCSLPASGEAVTVKISITTPDMTPTIVDTISVTGSMTIYSDSAYTVTALALFITKTAYAKTFFTSTKATINSITVTNITATGSAVKKPPQDLISAVSNIAYTTGAASSATFNFPIDPTNFAVTGSDFGTMTVTATYTINYVGNSRRRSLPSTVEVRSSTTVAIARDYAMDPYSAASALAPWF